MCNSSSLGMSQSTAFLVVDPKFAQANERAVSPLRPRFNERALHVDGEAQANEFTVTCEPHCNEKHHIYIEAQTSNHSVKFS